MTIEYFDTAAERAVLAAILLDPEFSFHVLSAKNCTHEMFYEQRHVVIYQTCFYMFSKGKAIDAITVVDRLNKKGNVEKAGGRAYVLEMIDAIPTAAHLESYLDDIIEKHRLRVLHSCVAEIPRMIEDEQTSSEIVSSTVTKIMACVDVSVNERPETIHARSMKKYLNAKNGKMSGLPSFLEPINKIIGGYVPSNVYVLAGRPSEGKSSFMQNEVVHKAVDLGIPCAVLSLEMKEELLREMMACSLADVSAYAMFTGMYSDAQYGRVKDAFDLLKVSPIFIYDKRVTIEEGVAWLTWAARKHNIKFAAYDYLQLTRHSRGSRVGTSRNEQVGEWSAQLKDCAKRLNIPLLLVSQLSRAGNRLQDQTPLPPTMEALRDSGNIEQDADAIIALFKKPNAPMADFLSESDWHMVASVLKNRIGPIGESEVMFVRRRQRFESVTEYDKRVVSEVKPCSSAELFDKPQ